MVKELFRILVSGQWRIQDFPQGGAPTPKSAIIFHFFAENCMKMKEFGPRGGRASLAPPLGSANGSGGSRIFPGGAPTPKSAIIFQFFAENCMKMKEFGPPGGGARPWCPPLDPPMVGDKLRCNDQDCSRVLSRVQHLGLQL